MIRKAKVIGILTAAFVLVVLFSCKPKKQQVEIKPLTDNIGEKFELTDIVDTSRNSVTLDFSASEINIVDIWHNECPPCLEEIKEVPDLIKGKEGKVAVYCLSMSQFWLWKKTMKEHKGAFDFLAVVEPNLKHYNLMTKDNPRFKNTISTDRLKELRRRYKMQWNPAYFVIDRNGKILSRPNSIVEFLKELRQ
ncbi:redoxin [Chryseobacterium sp. 52]|uniref:peroxiredoxin family protein n=1 Tax=Chryseobacterium sp. 52 TaxID=2035213 RepID=UPI000C18F6ED|nr:redoxin family protein [Chryseobacterium sp. 52]PIF45298.1 redoxin [Chryseobacterium sp. 52]